jgi:ABC-2 type transport system permease protein
MTATTPAIDLDRRSTISPTVLWVEVRDELLGVVREPAALFFSVLMPVLFFGLFAGLFGADELGEGGVPVGTSMLATFGAYGVIGSSMLTPGIGLADARERGWLRVLRTSPVPVPITLAAKVAATLPYSLGVLVAMTATAGALGVLQITVVQWVSLAVALVVGSLPFALIGLAVGSLAKPNGATAILNAIIIPMAIAAGLWFPLELLPDWVATIAPALPAYHLAELAFVPVAGDGGAVGHFLALIGFTIVTAAIAIAAYRRSPT